MRTIHRSPFTVNKPDIEYKFFNHYNWKGLNTNKNYFDIDQETFENCQDVYMDENGVLKSRPSVKILTSSGLQDIVDEWVFDNIKVYKTADKLHIVDNGNTYSVDIDDKVKLLMFDNKLLIFTPTSIRYYKDGVIADSTNLIYIPETTIYTNGIKTDNSEQKNILTTSEITTYLYNNVDSINDIKLHGKTVSITINDDTYDNILFTVGLEKVLFSKKCKLDSSSYDSNRLFSPFFDETYQLPLISKQDYGNKSVTLLSRVNLTPIPDDVTYPPVPSYTHNIYYSLDDVIFKEIISPGVIIGLPKLMINEAKVVVAKEDGLYSIDLSDSSSYNTWTRFHTFKTKIKLTDEYFSSITIPDSLSRKPYNLNTTIGFKVFDNTRYAVAYAPGVGFIPKDTSTTPIEYITSMFVTPNINIEYRNDSFSDSFEYQLIYSVAAEYTYKYAINELIDIDMQYNNSNVYIVLSYNYLSYVSYDNYNLGEAQFCFSSYMDGTTRRNAYVTNRNIIGRNYDDYDISQLNTYSKLLQPSIIYKTYDGPSFSVLVYRLNENQDSENYLKYELTRLTTSHDGTVSVHMEATTSTLHTMAGDINEYNAVLKPGKLLTNVAYYEFDDVSISSIKINTKSDFICPIHINKYMSLVSCNYAYDKPDEYYLYSTNLSNDTITIKSKTNGILQNTYFDCLSFLNVLYASIGNILYISQNRYDEDGNLLLYFSDYNKHVFNENITNLHPISSSQVAVFFNNEIWYTDVQSVNDTYVYTINKSKLNVGCKVNSDIITTFDGKYVIFPSERGLVAMGYQDFVASTEQTLSYLSDNILSRFIEFSKNYCKLYLYKYWLACYNNDGVYLFDFRNNSWWYFNYKNISKIFTFDSKPLLLSEGREFTLNTSPYDYYDDVKTINGIEQHDIKWFLVSQKLHLGTLNYHKHIINITLNALQEAAESTTMKLKVRNYRLVVTDSKEESLEYDIDVLRTFVKRLNYFKVNQFQYKLSYDYDNAIPIPLAIDSISIKYNITGQVR